MAPVTPAVSAAGVLLFVFIQRRLLHCKSTGDKIAGVTGLSGAIRYRQRTWLGLGELRFHRGLLAGHTDFAEESEGGR